MPFKKPHSMAGSRTAGLAAASGVLIVGVIAGCGSSSSGSSADAPSSPSSSDSTTSAPAASSTPTVEQLTGVLLTADEVGATAKNTFTSSPASSDDSSSTGCAAIDEFQKAAKGSEKAKAGLSYDTADSKVSAEDDLSYVPDQAAALFKQLKTATASCSSFTVSGTQLALTTLPDPSVPGSDDTLAIQATATANGQPLTADIFMARFGDNVLQISYGGAMSSDDASAVAAALLTQAADKAQPVIKA